MAAAPVDGGNVTLHRQSRVVWLAFLAVAAVVVWASTATLDRVVRAPGTVVPAGRTQIVQNLEGGIITEILVREGDAVRTGQLLLSLDRTRFEASVGELQQEIVALSLRRARLVAELAQADEMRVPFDDPQLHAELVETERKLFRTRRESYVSRIENLRSLIGLKRDEVSVLEPLVKKGAVPQLQLMQARQSLAELSAELERYRTEYNGDVASRLAETTAQLSRLDHTIRTSRDQLARTRVISPSDGIVNQIHFNTVGAVVGPGEPILEIVPSSDELRIEARISTQDVGFVAVGMDATLKVTAYDYTVYGTLLGRLTQISADTVPDDTMPNAPPVFVATIEMFPESLKTWRDRGLDIRSGLVIEVELQATETRIIDYILRPVLRARDAVGEV